ncbi:MAG: hypothetical protein QE278_03275 [Limnobacter sp.]|nr:hypothetical protein [Limnobacter sp.]
MKKSILFSLLVLSFASTQVMAANLERSEKREARQEGRISDGVLNGSLTQKEATRLQKREHKIDRMQLNAASDGKVTKREAARIEHAQDHASRAIYRQKHDKQNR